MFEFINYIGNYDTRKLGRTEVNGVTVSTAYTSDEGYETAILDANGAHPVERYDSKSEAETVETVTMLGDSGGLWGDEAITIIRIVGLKKYCR